MKTYKSTLTATLTLTVFAVCITLLTFMVAIPSAFAEPVKSPENNHYYEYIDDYRITWTDAKAAAEALTHNGVS